MFDRISSGKCCYCGVSVASDVRRDLDHYRPVNAVQYDNLKYQYGYYWLSADWDNLITSCHPCNSLEEREIFIVSTQRFIDKIVGKWIHFPLNNPPTTGPSHVIGYGGEEPLIFNPFKEDPKIYFEYVFLNHERGNLIYIKPKDGLNELDNKIAINSLSILGLNRMELCRDRHDQYTLTALTLNNLQNAINSKKKTIISDLLKDLLNRIDSSITYSSFSGMLWSQFSIVFFNTANKLAVLENRQLVVNNELNVISEMKYFQNTYKLRAVPQPIILVPRN